MHFIQNKYYKWYIDIISRSYTRLLPATTYTEKHHIIPKSLGGNNAKTNIVILTAREHFICHWLLTKITESTNKNKMIYALCMMNTTGHNQFRYITGITSRVFEQAKGKLVVSEETKQKMRKPKSEETKQKMRKPKSEETKQKMRDAKTPEAIEKIRLSKLGRVVSQETRDKLSTSLKGKIRSIESRRNISEAHKGQIPWNKGMKKINNV